MGDVVSGVGLRPYWFRLPGPGCQQLDGIFWINFCWKRSYNLSILKVNWLSSVSGSKVKA